MSLIYKIQQCIIFDTNNDNQNSNLDWGWAGLQNCTAMPAYKNPANILFINQMIQLNFVKHVPSLESSPLSNTDWKSNDL